MYNLTPEQALKAFEYNKAHFAKEKLTYASGQVLANIAYELSAFPDTDVEAQAVWLMETDGSWEQYHAHPFKNDEGLSVYAFSPVNTSRKEIKLSFKGTSDTESAKRDLDRQGPGSQSMALAKDLIISKLNDLTHSVYGRFAGNVKVTVAGHSLGGSDTENFSAYLCQDIGEKGWYSPYRTLSVFSLNSPGVSHAMANMSNQALKAVKENLSGFTVEPHFGKSEQDVIQLLGDTHIFNHVDPSLAHITLLEEKKNISNKLPWENPDVRPSLKIAFHLLKELLARLQAHSLGEAYFAPDQDGKLTDNNKGYKYLDSQNPTHILPLKEELRDKALWTLTLYRTMCKGAEAVYAWAGDNVSLEGMRNVLNNISPAELLANVRNAAPQLNLGLWDRYKQANATPKPTQEATTANEEQLKANAWSFRVPKLSLSE